MIIHRKTSLTFLASAAMLLAGCTQREADSAPALNATEEQKQVAAAAAERATVETQAKAEQDALAAKEKAETERLAAEHAAAEKAEAARVAAEEAKAKAESDRLAAEHAAGNTDTPKVAAAAPAPVIVIGVAPAAASGDVSAATKEAVEALKIPEGYAVKGRTVIQVNRVRASGDAVFDRRVATDSAVSAIASHPGVVTTNSLNASNRNGSAKAMFFALEPESKALGLIPSRKLTDAPVLFLNTVVDGAGDKPTRVVVSVVDADSGKVIATETRSL